MVRSLPGLEAFYWVVRLGGFQAAATRLGMSQPAISTRVKELERRAGRTLLSRDGSRVLPTPYGAATFEYAGRILAMVDDLESRLRSGGPVRGTVRLGTPDGFAIVCLGDLLKLLALTEPGLRLAITVGNSRALEDRLRNGDLDLAVLSDASETRDLRTQVLGEQEVAWFASPTLDLPAKLTSAGLFRSKSSPTRRPRTCSASSWIGSLSADDTPPPLSHCDSVAVITSLVTAGAGISILPRCIVQAQLDAGVLRQLAVRPAPPNQRIVAAWMPGRDVHSGLKLIPLVRQVGEAAHYLS